MEILNYSLAFSKDFRDCAHRAAFGIGGFSPPQTASDGFFEVADVAHFHIIDQKLTQFIL
ncbi:MAG: hypothetical protein AAF723_02330 [Pseudomonadota bacterium]